MGGAGSSTDAFGGIPDPFASKPLKCAPPVVRPGALIGLPVPGPNARGGGAPRGLWGFVYVASMRRRHVWRGPLLRRQRGHCRPKHSLSGVHHLTDPMGHALCLGSEVLDSEGDNNIAIRTHGIPLGPFGTGDPSTAATTGKRHATRGLWGMDGRGAEGGRRVTYPAPPPPCPPPPPQGRPFPPTPGGDGHHTTIT